MMNKYIIICCLLLISKAGFSQILTIAENSNFESTSYNKDVNEFITNITKNSKISRIETLAVSPGGNKVPLVIIADPMPKSLQEIKNDKRVVLYIQANIHAGEVEGKEASQMLIRDLLTGTKKEWLKNIIYLICPDFNQDGNDQISKLNRTYQNGPKNGVGIRYNAQMLDLNRDAMKLESPEVNGLVKVLNSWDPQIFIDLHTTNGSYHEEPVTFTWMMNPAGDRGLIKYMEKQMMPEISKNLLGTYKVDNCFYGEFRDMGKPELGWEAYAVEPRYIVNYIGVRNRIGILNENYVYADYKTRVLGSYSLLKSLSDYASAHAGEIKALIKATDQKTIERGLNPMPADSFAIDYKGYPLDEKITIKTFEVELKADTSGWDKYNITDRKKTVTVPYIADYHPTKNVKFPFAYLITAQDPALIDLLKRHGIQLSYLKNDRKFMVEKYKIKDLKPNMRLNQGHYNNSISGEYIKDTIEFKTGTLVVRTSQPLANLAAYLLEPESNDGLVFWNFLDKFLVPQWGRGYNIFPVYKVLNKVEIETAPVQ
ncbi:MAG: M14 family metallopeptidase [Bacteroidales bacterium]